MPEMRFRRKNHKKINDMSKSFLFLADGFEEIEALATVDILRRGGMEVSTVSINSGRDVAGAHGVVVRADLTFDEACFAGSDWLIMPGGMPGAANLHAHAPLNALLKAHEGRLASICASPSLVLGPAGVLRGLPATCYPGMEQGLVDGGGIYKEDGVVVTDRVITGRGPGFTFDFALAIVAATAGESRAREVAAGLLYA